MMRGEVRAWCCPQCGFFTTQISVKRGVHMCMACGSEFTKKEASEAEAREFHTESQEKSLTKENTINDNQQNGGN